MYFDMHHMIAKCRSQKVARVQEIGEWKSAFKDLLLVKALPTFRFLNVNARLY